MENGPLFSSVWNTLTVCWKIYEKAHAAADMKIQTKFNERRTNTIRVIKKVKLTLILSSVHVDS